MEVSVIIPLYNGRAFIKRAITSVFQQTRLPLELIIVDDASTDASVEVVHGMIAEAPIPVKILKMDTNSGRPAIPLNKGVCEAGGELLAILDQDDYFLPEKLDKMAAVLASTPSVRLVFSDFIGGSRFSCPIITEGRDWLRDNFAQQAGSARILQFDSGAGISMLLRYANVAYSFSGMLFYREDLLKKGGFDESLMIAADYDFICWIALRHCISYAEKPLFYKEVHGDNLSRHTASDFENSAVFLKYLWQAKTQGIPLRGEGLQKKALQRWGVYTAECRKNKNFRAPLALNFFALSYFRFNFRGVKALIRLWSEWFLKDYLNSLSTQEGKRQGHPT